MASLKSPGRRGSSRRPAVRRTSEAGGSATSRSRATTRRTLPSHGRHGTPVHDARNRRGRVLADARQLHERARLRGKAAAEALLHDSCRAVQVASARVVAETLPLANHVVERSGGQHVPRRKPAEPAREVGRNRVGPGLLQHEFRHQDPIGRPGRSPGERPSGPVEVIQEHGSGNVRHLSAPGFRDDPKTNDIRSRAPP